MGKIAQMSVKYIINATLKADGLVDRPDIIGAIFGQTEGLLGNEMELRELQKSGRIGRIEVKTFDKDGKTTAKIKIPSSLDKTQTAIIAAAIETIERIGPCNGKIILDKIEDVRSEKRDYIQERAKQILSKFIHETSNTESLKNEINKSVKEAEIILYGVDKLPAGPDVETSDELIIVEGRADVLALLRARINNAIAVNGTSIPKTVVDLMRKKKTNIAFVDGDRGGDLIVKSLKQVGRIDFVAKAPSGKEVEELESKEILKALRSKVPVNYEKHEYRIHTPNIDKDKLKELFKEIEGKKVIRLFDNSYNLLGEVPLDDLKNIRGISDVFVVVADAPINDELLYLAKNNGASILVGTKLETRKRTNIKLFTKRMF